MRREGNRRGSRDELNPDLHYTQRKLFELELESMDKRGDLHRLWYILGALDALGPCTVVQLCEVTSLCRSSVIDNLTKLLNGQVAGVTVVKEGRFYSIEKWTDFRTAVHHLYVNREIKANQ